MYNDYEYSVQSKAYDKSKQCTGTIARYVSIFMQNGRGTNITTNASVCALRVSEATTAFKPPKCSKSLANHEENKNTTGGCNLLSRFMLYIYKGARIVPQSAPKINKN